LTLKLFSCKLLADENIQPSVIQFLRQQRCDVENVASLGMVGEPDNVILNEALKNNRIVLTHDRDFGRLAILIHQPMRGIVFLRPGHMDPQFTISTLQMIEMQDLDFSASFILVARRRGSLVQLRLRRW
jgi:predicted nuclease of predicted toxin-antitoxin system